MRDGSASKALAVCGARAQRRAACRCARPFAPSQVEELIQSSRQARADDKVNNEIAILKEAFVRLQSTRKIAKGINTDMIDSVNRTQELVQSLLAKAEKDNGSIYLMKVGAAAVAGAAGAAAGAAAAAAAGAAGAGSMPAGASSA